MLQVIVNIYDTTKEHFVQIPSRSFGVNRITLKKFISVQCSAESALTHSMFFSNFRSSSRYCNRYVASGS